MTKKNLVCPLCLGDTVLDSDGYHCLSFLCDGFIEKRGPGQPKRPYKTKTVRIPVDLEGRVKKMVDDYKRNQGA